MLYTHEQMKNKFGTIFIVNILNENNIEEHYNTDYLPYETYLTKEEASQSFIDKANICYKQEIEKTKKIVSIYDKKSKISKLLSIIIGRTKDYKEYLVAKASIENAEKKLRESIDKIESAKIKYLDVSKTYEIEYPDLKITDIIYLVVLEKNLLEEGFYEGEIYDIKYSLVNDNQVKFTGAFKVNIDGEEESLQLNTESNGKLRDGYMHHLIFCNKNDARKLYQDKMNEKLNFFMKKVKE